jgi:hypothetical protein
MLRTLGQQLHGPGYAALERGEWERFRDTRLPAILEAARALPDVRAQAALFVRQARDWLLDQPLDATKADPDSGRASTFRPADEEE